VVGCLVLGCGCERPCNAVWDIIKPCINASAVQGTSLLYLAVFLEPGSRRLAAN
jgi:hypothetical protein